MNLLVAKIIGVYKYQQVKGELDPNFNPVDDKLVLKVYIMKEKRYIFLHCYEDLKLYFPSLEEYLNDTLKSLNKNGKGKSIDIYFDGKNYQYKRLYSKFKK